MGGRIWGKIALLGWYFALFRGSRGVFLFPQERLLDIQPWPGLVTSEENKSCSSVASRRTWWPRHQHSPEHRRLMMARRISASRVKTSLTSPVRVYPVSLSWESCGCHETCSLSSSKHSVAPQIVLKINFLPIKISLNMVRYSARLWRST